jgi:hypothetical protein
MDVVKDDRKANYTSTDAAADRGPPSRSHTGLRLGAAPHSPLAKLAPAANRKTCGERAPNTARMFIDFRLGLRLHARNSR